MSMGAFHWSKCVSLILENPDEFKLLRNSIRGEIIDSPPSASDEYAGFKKICIYIQYFILY